MRSRILDLLGDRGFEHRHHPAIESAEHAAEVRETPLAIGGKSLVLKLYGRGFGVFAISAARRTSNRAIRHRLGIQRLRFATGPELLELTGLGPGAVPPFGRPIFDLPLYVDESLLAQERIAFTLGGREESVILGTRDWLEVAQPADVFSFSR